MIANANSIRIPLKDGSVHCCVTSPPYWGLRDYGLPGTPWPAVTYTPMAGLAPVSVPGCDPECAHVWGEERILSVGNAPSDKTTMTGGMGIRESGTHASGGSWCQRCGGWRGCLGLEPTPEMFVGHIVAIFREVWRVLRDDGTLWLNFGDSYASSGKAEYMNGKTSTLDSGFGLSRNPKARNNLTGRSPTPPGLKPKDLVGIPWRVAFALQADGWYLRNDIIWHKPNPMPESVTDRCTKAHEYLFLLAKSKRYFYDAEAVKEGSADPARTNFAHGAKMDASRNDTDRMDFGGGNGRNRRTVWTISTRAYRGAHFATFPPELVSPCILAGTSHRGTCLICGAPWERYTKEKKVVQCEYENKAMQGVQRVQSNRPISPSDEENLQRLRRNEEATAQIGKSGTGTGNGKTLQRNTSRTDSGTRPPIPSDGARQGIDACGRSQVPAHSQGQTKIEGTGGAVGKDGKGQTEQPYPLCPETRIVGECPRDIYAGRLDTHTKETKPSLPLLRGALYTSASGDDRPCDTVVKGGRAQSREHSGSMSPLQFEKVEPATSELTTTGWRPTCDHDADPVPATVLDPFCGSGTTGEVCRETGRRFYGLDLSARYLRDFALVRAEHKQTPASIAALPLFEL